MSEDWNSMQMKGGMIAALGGAWIGDFACNLVGVAVGVDIPNNVELVSEMALGMGLGVGGMQAGAELDWRRRLDQDLEPSCPCR